MTPAWGWVFWVLWAVILTLDWESPVTGVEMKRNWSDGPWIAAPAAVTVTVPLAVASEPATPGLRMSWQVSGPAVALAGLRDAGQLGSAGGTAVAELRPKA